MAMEEWANAARIIKQRPYSEDKPEVAKDVVELIAKFSENQILGILRKKVSYHDLWNRIFKFTLEKDPKEFENEMRMLLQ